MCFAFNTIYWILVNEMFKASSFYMLIWLAVQDSFNLNTPA